MLNGSVIPEIVNDVRKKQVKNTRDSLREQPNKSFSIVQRYRKNINLLDGVHVQIIFFFYLINFIVCDNNV
jgi:hypothetical protein